MSESNVRKGAEIPVGISLSAGAFSGVLARFFVAPIDVVKIRMQLQTDATKYETITKAVTSIIRDEGLGAFWKGNVPAELMYLVYGASQFALYSAMNTYTSRVEDRYKLNIPGPIHSLIIGSVSGCLGTCVSYPFDLLRTRLVYNEKPQFASLFGEVSQIIRHTGFSGFFGGGVLSVTSVALSSGISFACYTFLRDETKGTRFEGASGLLAGAISKTVIYPLDLLKRRRQVSTTETSIKMSKAILASEGIKGFYHGIIPSVIKSAPTTMLSLYFYELATGWLMKRRESFAMEA
ncbi:DEKNAAC102298 [Brettanomyces naardenensis]|uniref:DEKNAAC102298 n=1 Tax=Brettanomyces naardenensis TaxID=13370 RepID=A0A448YKU2_BRENA|nr:DEKNAAC102298 [Brettanomyces naardenensis]